MCAEIVLKNKEKQCVKTNPSGLKHGPTFTGRQASGDAQESNVLAHHGLCVLVTSGVVLWNGGLSPSTAASAQYLHRVLREEEEISMAWNVCTPCSVTTSLTCLCRSCTCGHGLTRAKRPLGRTGNTTPSRCFHCLPTRPV